MVIKQNKRKTKEKEIKKGNTGSFRAHSTLGSAGDRLAQVELQGNPPPSTHQHQIKRHMPGATPANSQLPLERVEGPLEAAIHQLPHDLTAQLGNVPRSVRQGVNPQCYRFRGRQQEHAAIAAIGLLGGG